MIINCKNLSQDCFSLCTITLSKPAKKKIILFTSFYFEIQKLRLQSGLVRKIQVQFLWYGTRTGSRDKSGAYLFLPADEGAQVRPA